MRLKLLGFLFPGVLLLLFFSCSLESAKKHYILAEKLWDHQDYEAAVFEFEKVFSEEPQSDLAIQALYRAAETQSSYLFQYQGAIQKWCTYIQMVKDPQKAKRAKMERGEIFFTKLENYSEAIKSYEELYRENPKAAEASEFLLRVGKSQFYLLQFDQALKTYEKIREHFPATKSAEKAEFETAVTFFTRGGHYEKAMQAYQSFRKHYPDSELSSDAQFGIASCLEELNRSEEALVLYKSLLKNEGSLLSQVQEKAKRIQERIDQQKESFSK